MERFIFEDEDYIVFDNKITDESFIIPHDCQLSKVATAYMQTKDYRNADGIALKTAILFAKANLAYTKCIELGMQLCDNFKNGLNDIEELRMTLPIMTSSYRNIGNSKKAIELYLDSLREYGDIISSVPLLTSVSAAYCDQKEYQKAKDLCDYAYFKQGGGLGYTTELSQVYKRIQKETT